MAPIIKKLMADVLGEGRSTCVLFSMKELNAKFPPITEDKTTKMPPAVRLHSIVKSGVILVDSASIKADDKTIFTNGDRVYSWSPDCSQPSTASAAEIAELNAAINVSGHADQKVADFAKRHPNLGK